MNWRPRINIEARRWTLRRPHLSGVAQGWSYNCRIQCTANPFIRDFRCRSMYESEHAAAACRSRVCLDHVRLLVIQMPRSFSSVVTICRSYKKQRNGFSYGSLEERQSELVQFLLLNNHRAREVNNLMHIPLKKTPAPVKRCLPQLALR
jgi:hypothetical protein